MAGCRNQSNESGGRCQRSWGAVIGFNGPDKAILRPPNSFARGANFANGVLQSRITKVTFKHHRHVAPRRDNTHKHFVDLARYPRWPDSGDPSPPFCSGPLCKHTPQNASLPCPTQIDHNHLNRHRSFSAPEPANATVQSLKTLFYSVLIADSIYNRSTFCTLPPTIISQSPTIKTSFHFLQSSLSLTPTTIHG